MWVSGICIRAAADLLVFYRGVNSSITLSGDFVNLLYTKSLAILEAPDGMQAHNVVQRLVIYSSCLAPAGHVDPTPTLCVSTVVC